MNERDDSLRRYIMNEQAKTIFLRLKRNGGRNRLEMRTTRTTSK
jgi:hypothetical protein